MTEHSNDHTAQVAPTLETAAPPSRDELLAELQSARAAQQRLRTQIERAALLCGTAVVLIGVIAMAVARRRDFQDRPGEAQTWVIYGILYGLGLVAAASLARSFVLVVNPNRARAAREATATATSRLYAFDSAQHYLPTTATPDRPLTSPPTPPGTDDSSHSS
jgi:hypothetical protein